MKPKIDEKSRILIAETIRKEKEKNADMLYDLAVYGRIIEDGEDITPNDNESIVSSTIDLTGEKPIVYDKVVDNKTNETRTIKRVYENWCSKRNCYHNKDCECQCPNVVCGKFKCNEENNYKYFEEDK